MKTIGIVAHSYEGGSLCFMTACREGAVLLGPHMHPNIVVSAIPMGLSMEGWENNVYNEVIPHLSEGVMQVMRAGADFFICPDNTAHIVLEDTIGELPIPGLHIADVVSYEISKNGWKKVGLLGTRWTMTGPVYKKALQNEGFDRIIPDEGIRERLNNAIFDELCQGTFHPETIDLFVNAIEELKNAGAECVILGCTEIPLIINSENSPLPVLDTTRLLAKHAVRLAISDKRVGRNGWVKIDTGAY